MRACMCVHLCLPLLPIADLLIGIGLPYSYAFIAKGFIEIELQATVMNTLLYVTLMTSLCITLVYLIFNRFHSSRLHAAILLGIYLIYLALAAMIEFKVFK